MWPFASHPSLKLHSAGEISAGARAKFGDLLIDGLTKSYGELQAVNAIDLTVRDGEFLTLLGPSGSGKTTLLMMIAGFVEPTSGRILLDGSDMTDLLPEHRDFGMVFQGYALFPHMTVSENIAYPLEIRRHSAQAIKARVQEMLELVQLEKLGNRYPRQLSGGQQQRVALARALSFKPRLLLLDEPLGALDRKLRVEVQNQLKDLHTQTGTTFIYVTHDQEEALSMSDRIAIMNHGQIIQLDQPNALYEQPASVFAASFLGKSNFIRTRVISVHNAMVTFEAGGFHFQQTFPTSGKSAGDAALLAIRPEKIKLSAEGLENASTNQIKAEIRRISYFGNVLEIELNAHSVGEITASVPAWRQEGSYKPGQTVTLGWNEDAAVIVRDDGAVGEA